MLWFQLFFFFFSFFFHFYFFMKSSEKFNNACVDCRKALDKSEVLMNMNHGIVRLDNVWGVGGGIRPVKILIKKVGVSLLYANQDQASTLTQNVTGPIGPVTP